MKVVVVESPAKAKTINRYLGDGYKVLASYGHVCDLPSKDGSVLPDNDFEMKWQYMKACAPKDFSFVEFYFTYIRYFHNLYS